MGMGASTARYNLGVALAYRGRHDEASMLLTGTIEAKTTDDWDRQRGVGALGFVALARGDAALAVEHLTEWHALLRAMHFREPGYSRSHLDFVEALVATGRIEPGRGVSRRTRRPGPHFRAAVGGGDRDDRSGPDRRGPRRRRPAADTIRGALA